MNALALRVENVSKMYRLGEVGTGTLSHDLNRLWARITGKEDPFAKVGSVNDRTATGTQDNVWALRDINFDVNQGEIVGIIGRNGAGKSTLLKLLSRVTAPTEGSIYINGRIASLLEVGTGFHPELTGRENIFLNGAILGMTKREVLARFDEIVEFSGCAKYIDTPVKRYSSGMHVRLAFAVAAHLETDILIVDEVLAVGDAEFQSKCLGKMQDLSRSGHRTVLFVSHNMAAVKRLCPRSLLMERGGIKSIGDTDSIIEQYMTIESEFDRCVQWPEGEEPHCDELLVKSIRVQDTQGRINVALNSTDDVCVEVAYTALQPLKNFRVSVTLYASSGELIFITSDYFAGGQDIRMPGNYVSMLRIPGRFLLDMRYVAEVDFEIARERSLVITQTCNFHIVEIAHDCLGPKLASRIPGLVHPDFKWEVRIV